MSILDSLIEKESGERLPSLPVVGLRILEAIKGDVFSVEELTGIIQTDPALAARTLRMANSSLYCHIPEVDSIDRAVAMLGAKVLKNLALTFVIVREMMGDDLDGFDYELFWKSSVTAAVAAETLNQGLNKRSEDTFVTSLLMNVGMIVMHTCRREDYRQVLGDKRILGGDLAGIERRIFGFDHQDVGMEILKKWNIPESIYNPIAFHHDIADCPPEFLEATVTLRVSRIVSSIYNVDKRIETMDGLYKELKERFGFDKKRVNEFMDEVAVKTLDVLSIYNIEPGDMKPYSQLMEEANQELGKLNVSYEHFVLELKETKARAEGLAKELTDAMADIKILSGFLPICAYCKKIRDDKGCWNQIEAYIRDHSEADFTHGLCPACVKNMLEEVRKI